MRHEERLQLLAEARALEDAGGVWTQRHAAAVTGRSVSFIRASDCPKHLEENMGPKGRKRVVYLPPEVRAWQASRRIRAEDQLRRVG